MGVGSENVCPKLNLQCTLRVNIQWRATISPKTRSTGGASMVKLEFHDPSGALEVTQPHAPRLASLEGKRIGFVSNEQWQAYRMLPMLKEMLEQDFPGITVLPIHAYPQGNAP